MFSKNESIEQIIKDCFGSLELLEELICNDNKENDILYKIRDLLLNLDAHVYFLESGARFQKKMLTLRRSHPNICLRTPSMCEHHIKLIENEREKRQKELGISQNIHQ